MGRSAQWLNMLMVIGLRLDRAIRFLDDLRFECYDLLDPRFCTLKTKYTNVFRLPASEPTSNPYRD